MKRTGTENPRLKNLIEGLKKSGSSGSVLLFKRLAYDLERSTRARRIVNISRLNRNTKEGEVIVVPGKVLGDGILDHSLTIYAFSYSEGALASIKKAKAEALGMEDILKENIKGKKIRIIG